MVFQDKNIFILGLGISGKSAGFNLARLGANVFVYDEKVKDIALDHKNISFVNYQDIDFKTIDFLMLSPAIPYAYNSHEIVSLAKKHNVKILSDIELFLKLVPKAQTIAITGTNGKSTTTNMIYHLLKNILSKVQMGGNIGVPVFDLEINDSEDSFYVFETSSYQLDLIEDIDFDFGVLLNITPDHLDRYDGEYKNYQKSKFKIISNSKKAVVNFDDERCFELAKNLEGKIISFSCKNEGVDIFYSNSKIFYENKKLDLSDIDIKKFGNIQNLLSSFAIGRLIGFEGEKIIKILNSYKALSHRFELVREISGLKFYNDSKATNAESSINAIEQLQDIYWIAGGVAKAGGIEKILGMLDNIDKIFLIGEAKDYFAQQLEEVGYKNFQKFDDLEGVLASIMKDKGRKQNILFSPASASFDMWNNFEERGDYFKKLVNKL